MPTIPGHQWLRDSVLPTVPEHLLSQAIDYAYTTEMDAFRRSFLNEGVEASGVDPEPSEAELTIMRQMLGGDRVVDSDDEGLSLPGASSKASAPAPPAVAAVETVVDAEVAEAMGVHKPFLGGSCITGNSPM